MPSKKTENLGAAVSRAYPELEAVASATDEPVYLVGGAVRDLLLGRGRSGNVDLVVVGDAARLAERLGTGATEHERFATATAALGDLDVDFATARSETYARPGALPDVSPVDELEADLRRRDFTVNALAVSLADGKLIDLYGGRDDLDRGLLRVLHPGSFVDDPTRALRAARYAARLGFSLEEETERLLRRTDLSTVSEDRRRSELLRIAAEPSAARGFELLGIWGLVDPRPGGVELARQVVELLDRPPWRGEAPRERAVLAAALGPPGRERELAVAKPSRPSEAVRLAHGADPIELVLGRALGAEWLDRYLREWRDLSLEIDGDDLLAAGVPRGPAIGAGLAAALRRKLDGELEGRAAELAAALEGAKGDALG